MAIHLPLFTSSYTQWARYKKVNKSLLKILVVHNYYQQSGGEYTAVKAQLALLRQYGHQVIVYTKDNATINHFNLVDKLAFLPNTFFSRTVYDEVVQLIQQEQPDIAHVHNVFPLISPAVYRALADQGVPIVQTLHNFRFFCTNSLFYTQGQICERCKSGNTLHAIRFRCYHDSYTLSALYALTIGQHRRLGTFQLINRFIALNEFAVKTFVESGFTMADKMTVLGNFLPEPLPEAGSFSHRQPYVLFLGRLSAEKGVQLLIDAMASVPDLTLKVLGKGAEKEALQRHVQELGLNHVEFLGWVGGSEKWHLLRQATASVMPSVCYEQFPLAALESLAVGTPVIASNLGGLPTLIKHEKTGLLFKAADVTELANQLNRLASCPQLVYQMGSTARQTVESEYVASVHYEKLMAIYDEVIS